MTTEKLTAYEQYFAEQIPHFGHDSLHTRYQQQCLHRIDSLRAEIQHREAFGVGRKTLFWARWAVVAAVIVPILVALISEIPLSKLLHAKAPKPSFQADCLPSIYDGSGLTKRDSFLARVRIPLGSQPLIAQVKKRD